MKRSQLEDKALEIMDQIDNVAAGTTVLGGQLQEMEAEWQQFQQQISGEIEQVNGVISDLRQEREQQNAKIDPQISELYHTLRKQRGTAIARVEQGRCLGCRIALPTTVLQRARTDSVVPCTSCGRILFLA